MCFTVVSENFFYFFIHFDIHTIQQLVQPYEYHHMVVKNV